MILSNCHAFCQMILTKIPSNGDNLPELLEKDNGKGFVLCRVIKK